MAKRKVSIYMSYLLRHRPEDANLHMDRHGWVPVKELIAGINGSGKYAIDREQIEAIVAADEKGRFRLSEDGARIKACQGHSIPWVEPELTYREPPEYLYHGTTAQAYAKIRASGAIQRMKRHAVHMQADEEKAWQSAERWHATPVVLKISAGEMCGEGFSFGVSDNMVWCVEEVPVKYICEEIWRGNPMP